MCVCVCVCVAGEVRNDYECKRSVWLSEVEGKNPMIVLWNDAVKKKGVCIETIYARILIDRVLRVTEGFIHDERGGFRSGTGCVDQILTLKQCLRYQTFFLHFSIHTP